MRKRKVTYSSKIIKETWFCTQCEKGGKGGHFPAQAHHRATEHKVMVIHKAEYVYG